MAFNIFRLFSRNTTREELKRMELENIKCSELIEAAQEIAIRELAFDVCVNMVARYVAACEFKTYKKGKAVKELEYYTWNIEPNKNQNKTAFLYKLIRQLYIRNEALIVTVENKSGRNAGLAVADEWECKEKSADKQNEYTAVRVENTAYTKAFPEDEVLHIVLSENPAKPVLDRIYDSYYRLVSAAMGNFEWNAGKHWKVHIDQLSSGSEDFVKTFQKTIEDQIKPFLQSNSAILPEFDGYTYSDVSEARASRSATGETADIRGLIEDIFDFTAQAFGIPPVLVKGKVENTSDAKGRFYTLCDGILNQLAQEINRKRYGFERWKQKNYVRIDSSNVEHFSLLDNSANLEKVIGSAVYSVNDVLEAIGQPTIDEDWAYKHYLTKNIGVLNNEAISADTGESPPVESQKGGNTT